MNNEMKLLRAFIEASGFDVESVCSVKELPNPYNSSVEIIHTTDYKVTKRKGRSKLHRVVREYEAGKCSISEMINEIARIEGILNENI